MTNNFKGPSPGRPFGSKNKPRMPTTVFLVEQLAKSNFDPIAELIILYRDADTSAGTKQRIIESLLKLTFPTLRSQEITGQLDHHHLTVSWLNEMRAPDTSADQLAVSWRAPAPPVTDDDEF